MINLIPSDIKQNIRYGRHNIILVQYCVLVAAISFSLLGILFFGLTIIGRDQTQLENSIASKTTRLAELADIQKQAKELSESIETINALLDREIEFSYLLQEIGAIIPEGAYLTDLGVTGDVSQPLSIRATVNSQTLAAVLQRNLEDSELFTGADIQSINAGLVDADGNVSSYTVEIVVQFAEVPKEDEAAQ